MLLNSKPITSPARKSLIAYASYKQQPVSIVKTYGRFSVETENLHGRLAMMSLVACAFRERAQSLNIIEQLYSVTHVPPPVIGALLVVTTLGFVIHALNPTTPGAFVKDFHVFEKPGFTLET